MTQSPNQRYRQSGLMLERALKTIPIGSQTFSKSHISYPKGQAPLFLSRGRGSRIWDVDGNEYIDYVNGLLAITLGYCDPEIDNAIKSQIENGVSFSLSTEHEIRLAEKLVDLIPCAEMVRFGKNGSDATAAAVRLSRAYTGKDRVAVCGYHGWQDWYIGSTTRDKGVPVFVKSLTHQFEYNNAQSLEALFKAHPGEFSCIIMEPINIVDPEPSFLETIKDMAHREGALLVFDEIITGFRFHIGGAQTLFGVTPDLATFGKGMANGYPLSAVVGRSEIMREMDEIFFSFTAGGETLSLVAALATITKMESHQVVDHLWCQGKKIMDGLSQRITDHQLNDFLSVFGKPCWSFVGFENSDDVASSKIETLYLQEMLARGVLIQGTHNMSYAHGNAEITKLLDVYDEVLPILSDAILNGNTDKYLKCPPTKPIFKVR